MVVAERRGGERQALAPLCDGVMWWSCRHVVVVVGDDGVDGRSAAIDA